MSASGKACASLRRAHSPQAASQRLVDDVLEACLARAAQPLELNRHVLIKGQGRTHASAHIDVDALMSSGPGRRDQLPAAPDPCWIEAEPALLRRGENRYGRTGVRMRAGDRGG